jgi:hypothetical protein
VLELLRDYSDFMRLLINAKAEDEIHREIKRVMQL